MLFSDELYNKLKNELSYIKTENRFSFIKQRLLDETDLTKRQELESLLCFLQEAGVVGERRRETLVAMVHGIRTQAEWHDLLEARIKSVSDASVEPIDFGFLDSVRFMLRLYGGKLNHVSEEFRDLKSRYPDHEIVVIAHSFGTFLTTKFLEKNPDYNIERVLFCGSVVNENYHFAKLRNIAAGSLVNDVGTKDHWPVIAKMFSFGYGAAGTFGFSRSRVKDRYFNCGHSGFFNNEIFDEYWIPYLLNGQVNSSPMTTARGKKNALLSACSMFSGQGLIMVALLALLIFLFHESISSFLLKIFSFFESVGLSLANLI